MKTVSLFATALLFLFCNSCKKDDHCDSSDRIPLRIDLQEDYERQLVAISIDGRQIFSDTVITDHSIGIALSHVIPDTIACGAHTLKVVVAASDSATYSFELYNPLYIGVGHDPRNGQVSFHASDTPFLYL